MAERLLWEQEAAGSNPVTPMNNPVHQGRVVHWGETDAPASGSVTRSGTLTGFHEVQSSHPDLRRLVDSTCQRVASLARVTTCARRCLDPIFESDAARLVSSSPVCTCSVSGWYKLLSLRARCPLSRRSLIAIERQVGQHVESTYHVQELRIGVDVHPQSDIAVPHCRLSRPPGDTALVMFHYSIENSCRPPVVEVQRRQAAGSSAIGLPVTIGYGHPPAAHAPSGSVRSAESVSPSPLRSPITRTAPSSPAAPAGWHHGACTAGTSSAEAHLHQREIVVEIGATRCLSRLL